MQVNRKFEVPAEFHAAEEEIAELLLGTKVTVFEKAADISRLGDMHFIK